MVIIGSGEGAKIGGRLSGTVVVVLRSAGSTVLVVFVRTGTGSPGVYRPEGKLVKGLVGTILAVVDVNRGAGARRFTGTGTNTGPATTELICSLSLLTLQLGFL